jgi:hypothetical protein
MTRPTSPPAHRRSAAPMLLLFAGAALSILSSSPAAPLPKGRPEPQKDIVENWSLTLSLGSDKMSDDFRRPTTATITLRNHAKRARTIQEVRAPEGNLNWAEGLSYVVRFKDGAVIEVPNRTRGISGSFERLPRHLPIRVSAGGKVEGEYPTLYGLLFFNRGREAREAYRKCKVFAVTVVATEDGLNLRSNTVFVNGKFELPKGHDPIADAKAYREAKARKDKAKKPGR